MSPRKTNRRPLNPPPRPANQWPSYHQKRRPGSNSISTSGGWRRSLQC
ncbi:unnamed protein product [Linum tenue]|uniref:Uncharacterized protein n=1 Tax=Linum tenue TaxID=586396 RepID=A0AAV0LEZ9_9ROSI|nr:unnamed protein product [Linum tenue]